MNKKAIIILGSMFVVIVATLGFLIWQRNSTTTTPITTETTPENTQTPASTLPTDQVGTTTPEPAPEPILAKPEGAIRLTEVEVLGASLFYRGTAVSYLHSDGSFYQSELKGEMVISLANEKEVPIVKKANIRKVYWPDSGNGFIAEYRDQTDKKRFAYFSGDANTYTDLPEQISSVQWLPGGQKIIYIWIGKDGKATLNTSDPDGKNFKALANIYDADSEIKVSPNGQAILFYRTQNNGTENKIVFVTTDGKLFKTIVKDGFNSGVSWAPDSRHFVYGRKNNLGDFTIWIGDTAGDKSVNMNIVSTPDKVTWTTDSAVVIAAGRSLSGDVKSSKETIFMVSVADNSRKELDPKSEIDAREMFLSLKEDKLFFKNSIGGQLYYMDLLADAQSQPAPTATTPGTSTSQAGTGTQP